MEVELTIIDHHQAQTRVVLRSLPAIVGRNAKADVPLRDPWASHVHCALSETNGTLLVRDLGSKNGILLHQRHVTEANLLPGESFIVGRTEITVHYQRLTQTVVDLSARGTAIELGGEPKREAAPLPGPETRDLLYGDARDAAPHHAPPEDDAAGP